MKRCESMRRENENSSTEVSGSNLRMHLNLIKIMHVLKRVCVVLSVHC